jgi:hypothetical protein
MKNVYPRHPEMTKRETQITGNELRSLWTELSAQGICFNGCTHSALRARYGAAVRHIRDYGWVVDRKLAAKLKKAKES